jgi:DNA-binding beta-propeller fold protein YncE
MVHALVCFLAILQQQGSLLGDVGTASAARAGVVTIPLPGHPFGVVSSRDASWVFVALMGGGGNGNGPSANGVAVLRQVAGQFELKRVIPLQDGPAGLVLTHDGKTLIGAGGGSVVLLDTGRMTSGSGDPVIGKFSDGADSAIYVNVTADDKILFVSDEGSRTITVIDLARVRSGGFDARAVIGKIPVGEAPIALTLSPDGRWLYTTSEGALPDWGWPSTEKPEGRLDSNQPYALEPPGAVVVVNVAKARVDPAHSVVARVPAGGSPVRMTISSDGQRIYVTARGSNAVLVFDADKLISDSAHARLATVTVGSSPVPLALIQDGKTLVVGNSNRFGADAAKPQTLSVLDVAKMGHGSATVGTIAAGAFPREMCVSADGRILFVSNFSSNSLEVVDAENPPIESK